MTAQPRHMDFEHFETHLAQVFEEVQARNQPALIERNGEIYRLEKAPAEDIWKDYDPEKVQRALEASRGIFAGTDGEQFLREMHEQREQGPTRPD